MATKGFDEGPGPRSRERVYYLCHGCGVRFPGDAVGPGICSRCGAIGGHVRLGRTDPRFR